MDKYDTQIAELLAADDFPYAVRSEWLAGAGLFQFATRTGAPLAYGHAEGDCGCLTMIRGNEHRCVEGRPDLALEIRGDVRLPLRHEDVTAEHLPVFAEWQRRLDKELSR